MLTFNNLRQDSHRDSLFNEIETWLLSQGLDIDHKDMERPWGGFFVLADSNASLFAKLFFNEMPQHCFGQQQRLSPKILIVAPAARLSWQYHHRRAEFWKLIAGTASLRRSATDEEGDTKTLQVGEIVNLACGERHRLMGGEGWGIVAEIWQHTIENDPSNEDDIVRVQDDFGR